MIERRAVYAGYQTTELAVVGDGPTVLLLHGFGHSAYCWQRVLRRCAQWGIPAVAVDLPGFGSAGHLHAGSALPQLMSFCHAVIERYAEYGRVVVVGNSLGGLLALRLAAEPAIAERVHGVMAIDAAGFGWTRLVRLVSWGKDWPIKALGYAGFLPAALPEPLLTWGVSYLHFGRRDRVDPAIVAYVVGQLSNRSRSRRLLRLAVQVKGEVDRMPALGPVEVRTVVVHGLRDRLISLTAAERIRRLVRGSKLVVLPHAGHCPHLDEPDRITELVIELARSHQVSNSASENSR
ncbi:pimeloyl-ACP methyl ester carboxylesterase [Mycobacteroides chelonae]|nr:pimeloyl-ACP methyl ester carboxylesterase [Mycobacteroides chelonae]